MRYDVKKVLFVGIEDEREVFFKKAQEIGQVQFISPSAVKDREIPQEVQDLASAIKIVRGFPTLPQEDQGNIALADGLAQKILQLKHKLDQLEEEKRMTALEISRIEVFGDFSLDDIAAIEKEGNRKVQFFFAKKDFFDHHALSDELIKIGSDHGLDYFVSISKTPKQYEKMVEMKIEHPLGKLKQRHQEAHKEWIETEHLLRSYEKYNHFLHQGLVDKLNKYHLIHAKGYAEDILDGNLFAVQGWVPVNKQDEIQKLVDKFRVHSEEIEIEPTDTVPTYLENQNLSRMGEDLVHIYDSPSISDKDPSLWVLFFFLLFFAMIMGDGGYGLILLGIVLFIRYKKPNLKNLGKRVLNLTTLLAVFCIGWGLVTHSFFGMNLSPDNPLHKMAPLTWLTEKKADYHIQHQDAVYQEWVDKFPQLKGVTDPKEFLAKGYSEQKGKKSYDIISKFSDNIMLEFALFIGVIHIGISLIRYANRNWTAIGWLICLVGGYLYFPYYLDATSMLHYIFHLDKEQAGIQGLYLLMIGTAIAVIIAIFKQKFLGVFEAMTAIQVFSDVLSYLRLYALGLAGAIMASVINEMSESMTFVLALIVMILGHAVNFALAIMSGVIHGLRLNFLEWYHYSFEGGGKMFNPLRKISLD
ncbi:MULTISPECIES: V-type ATPase 116kDa subunit family protein [Parachlamydia]|uniref:V-type ATPase 116kDa subunit family protein n=1 Tax=Parachlamydia TaxID=83551 RepID=UPI0024E25320|nr:V-type ATPase 116kDa subunit family protein [Parachlamydia acanthamoebae]